MFIRNVRNEITDCKLIYSLSNDPIVRKNSFNQKPIEYENHCNWFSKILSDKNTLFFIVFSDEAESEFVGQIRFNRKSEFSLDCVISLSITESFRGKHIASQFIELGIEELKKNWCGIKSIIAEVKDENIASNKLFLKEGFQLVTKVNTYSINI